MKEKRLCVMVVDDSLTVRRVTGRLLRRQNMEVITAKDGVIEQGNYDNYPVIRMSEAPKAINVHIMQVDALPGGVQGQFTVGRQAEVGHGLRLGKWIFEQAQRLHERCRQVCGLVGYHAPGARGFVQPREQVVQHLSRPDRRKLIGIADQLEVRRIDRRAGLVAGAELERVREELERLAVEAEGTPDARAAVLDTVTTLEDVEGLAGGGVPDAGGPVVGGGDDALRIAAPRRLRPCGLLQPKGYAICVRGKSPGSEAPRALPKSAREPLERPKHPENKEMPPRLPVRPGAVAISSPAAMEKTINNLAGVVTCGLFAMRPADLVLMSTQEGVKQL